MEQRIVQKLSVVYISTGDETKVFRSLDEVPREIRLHLLRNSRTAQVETTVIANDKGWDLLESRRIAARKPPPPTGPRLAPPLRWALITLLASTVGLLIAFVWNYR